MPRARMVVPPAKEMDSEVTSTMTTFVNEQGDVLLSKSNHTLQQFENIEKQEEDEEVPSTAHASADFDEESWGFLALEAILYIPLLLQSLLGSMHIARALLFGETLKLILERTSSHAPWWLQRYNAVFMKIDSNVWPPPSFLLLAALTIVALIVHPDGFTWVILGKTRNGVLSFAQVTGMWWDILLNEHGAIVSSLLALATFGGLFFLAFVLRKTLSHRKPPDSAVSGKQKSSSSGKLQSKKKKRKGGCARINHRFGRNKLSSETNDRADESSTREESEFSSMRNGSSLSVSQHESSQQRQETSLTEVADNLPVYSSTLSPTSEVSRTVVDEIISLPDVSLSRDRSFSSSTTESFGTSISDNQSLCHSSDRGSHSTKSEDLQQDLARSVKGGNKAHFATQNISQQSGARKNTRRRTTRKLRSNDYFPKQAWDQPNAPVTNASRWDSLKSARADGSRADDRQGKRSFSTTESRNPNRSFTVVSAPNEIKSSQVVPSRKHSRWSAASSAYSRASSTNIQSTNVVSQRPGLDCYYYDGASDESFNQFKQAYAIPEQQPTAPIMDESWKRCRTHSGAPNSRIKNIPAPPGYGGSTGMNTNADINMPLSGALPVASLGGTHMPMFSSVKTYPLALNLQQTDLTDITRSHLFVKENPFDTSSAEVLTTSATTSTANAMDRNEEDRIEAELQELGGRMVGSILDF